MSIVYRIKKIISENELSAAAFADKIGVQRSSISHILSERNKPSLDFILKILRSFPSLSSDWLLLGLDKTEKIKTNYNELPDYEKINKISDSINNISKTPSSSKNTKNSILRTKISSAQNVCKVQISRGKHMRVCHY